MSKKVYVYARIHTYISVYKLWNITQNMCAHTHTIHPIPKVFYIFISSLTLHSASTIIDSNQYF